jgi:outer membrane protein assembly factor BamB
VLWTHPIELVDTPDTDPLIVNEWMIYSGEVEMTALNITTGKKIWGYEIGEGRAINSKYLAYSAYRDAIYFSHDEDFIVLNLQTGNQELLIENMVWGGGGHIDLENGYVVIGDTIGGYWVSETGEILNEYSLSMTTHSVSKYHNTLLFAQKNTIHGGLTLGRITAVDLVSGDSLWAYNTQNGGFYWARPILEDGILYAGTRGNSPANVFVALHSKTGEPLWEYITQNPFEFAREVVLGPNLMYNRSSAYVFALDKITGEKVWAFKWTSASGVNMVYLKGYLYLSDHGIIYVLDAETGELVHEEPLPTGNGYLWRLAVSEDKLFVQTSRHIIAYEPWHLREKN